MTAGKNFIRVFDVDKPTEKANLDLTEVTCTGEKCGKGETADGGGPKPAQKGSVHINSPTSGSIYNDTKTAPVGIRVDRKDDPKDNVKRVFVRVLNNGQPIAQPDNNLRDVPAPDAKDPKKVGEIGFVANIAKGLNQITKPA